MTEPTRDDSRGGASAGRDGDNPFPEFLVPPPGAASPEQPLRAAPSAVAPVPPLPPRMPARPPRARGTRLALFCAVVALAGAAGAVAAPSLRPILAEELRSRLGDRPWIGIVTGTADTRPPQVVELDLQRFDERISALTTALAETPSGQPVDRETLQRFVQATGEDERIVAMNDGLRRAEEQVMRLSTALAALETRLAAAEARDGRLEEAGRGLAGRLDAAETAARAVAPKISALEQKGAEGASRLEALTATVTELGTRLDDLGRRLTEAAAAAKTATAEAADAARAATAEVAEAARVATAEVAARVSALESGLNGLGERLTGAEQGTAAAVARIVAVEESAAGNAARLGNVEATVAAADGVIHTLRADVDGNRQQAAALGARLGRTEERVAAMAPNAAPVLLALANRIRTALDEGEPFAAELAAARPFAAGDAGVAAALDRLAPLAATGGPSLSLIRREFNTTAKKVIEAEEAQIPYWYERQITAMQTLIGWAPAPAPAPNGEAARAALGRAAVSITNGNFTDAVKELSALQPPGAAEAEGWVRLARVRVEAEHAVRAVCNGALRRLAEPAVGQ